MSKLKEKFIIKRGSEANDAVKKLIQEASNKENLAKMFVGKLIKIQEVKKGYVNFFFSTRVIGWAPFV